MSSRSARSCWRIVLTAVCASGLTGCEIIKALQPVQSMALAVAVTWEGTSPGGGVLYADGGRARESFALARRAGRIRIRVEDHGYASVTVAVADSNGTPIAVVIYSNYWGRGDLLHVTVHVGKVRPTCGFQGIEAAGLLSAATADTVYLKVREGDRVEPCRTNG